jgi:hypothetical protein
LHVLLGGKRKSDRDSHGLVKFGHVESPFVVGHPSSLVMDSPDVERHEQEQEPRLDNDSMPV